MLLTLSLFLGTVRVSALVIPPDVTTADAPNLHSWMEFNGTLPEEQDINGVPVCPQAQTRCRSRDMARNRVLCAGPDSFVFCGYGKPATIRMSPQQTSLTFSSSRWLGHEQVWPRHALQPQTRKH
jgi:hypothetical protein